MAVTLRDVAGSSGVSLQTVSRILNGNDWRLFRAETVRRVRSAARRLGYRPNAQARAVREGRCGSVALLHSIRDRPYFPNDLLFALEAELNANDSLLVLAPLPRDGDTLMPKALRHAAVDGFLIEFSSAVPERMLELVRRTGAPTIWINNKQETDSVYPDDLAAGREAAERLMALGHRRIVYVDFGLGRKDAHYSRADRAEGYRRAMRAAGLQALVTDAPRPLDEPERPAFLIEWLDREDRPTAFIAYSPGHSDPVHRAARSLGLSVPEDVSVIAFTENRHKQYGLWLSRMAGPWAEMGREAVRMLMTKTASPEKAFPSKRLRYTHVDGETCAPVSRAAGPESGAGRGGDAASGAGDRSAPKATRTRKKEGVRS
jgi:LacI family transcriptional regulator